jgi:signal transduction histidine kinase
MFVSVEWLLIGAAGLFEIVLLLLLCQPINRRLVAVWLKWLIGGACLYHLGHFARLVLYEERTAAALMLDRLAMLVVCAGLVMMPSAMLHASVRLYCDVPFQPNPQRDRRYVWLYSPLLLLIPAALLIFQRDDGNFMAAMAPLTIIYLFWLAGANLVAAGFFAAQLFRDQPAGRKAFFTWIILLLIVLTILAVLYASYGNESSWGQSIRVVVGMAPLIPSIVFVAYTFRNRILPVVFEESIIYGGITLLALLVHRLVVTPFSRSLSSIWDIDFVVVEVIGIVIVIWLIKPLRRRVGESLRFLLSPRAFETRNTIRRLAIEMTQRSSDSASDQCRWFCDELRNSLGVSWVRLIQVRDNNEIERDIESPHREQVPTPQSRSGIGNLMASFRSSMTPIERGQEATDETAEAMERLDCDLAFPLIAKSIQGCILFGSLKRYIRLADEQVISLNVLIEQFAVTLENQQAEERRRQLDRASFQQEKLSTLGMLSGSMAHELRNPLSSIRTIASLVSEELPASNSHRNDLGLIVSEVDRLSQTLQRMLDFARPANAQNSISEPDRVMSRLISIMEFHARQCHVALEVRLMAETARIASNELALNEIFMNLIKNGIEASRERSPGLLQIHSRIEESRYIVTFTDRGEGIPQERWKSIFLPFETSKPDGSGLGLYIVSQRVAELSGTIELYSTPEHGTTFTVSLPLVIVDLHP